jgi:hypothetical protein
VELFTGDAHEGVAAISRKPRFVIERALRVFPVPLSHCFEPAESFVVRSGEDA